MISARAATASISRSRPVPEPATWAMLISGFALAGAAVRRRSQQAVPSHA